MTAATRFPDSLIQGFPGAGHISGGKQFLAKGFFDHPVKPGKLSTGKIALCGIEDHPVVETPDGTNRYVPVVWSGSRRNWRW
jgi:hypothetical protein